MDLVGRSGVVVHDASADAEEKEGIPDDILVSFGNASGPGRIRVPVDIDLDPNNNVQPPVPPVTAQSHVKGKSLYGDPDKAPLTGWWWWIPRDTEFPDGIAVIADGSDVGGTRPPTHHTLFPTKVMPFAEFQQKYLGLGWGRGKKKQT